MLEDALRIAKKLEALGSTLSSRAKQYAGCSWLPDPSRPIADSMPGIWEYRQAALCAEAAAALRRYTGDGGVTAELANEVLSLAMDEDRCEIECCEILQIGQRLGFIEQVEYVPSVHGMDVDADDGDLIYVRTEQGKALAARAKSGEKGGTR